MPPRRGTDLGSIESDTHESYKSHYSILAATDCPLKYWRTFFIFATMGAGANWVCPTALAQQIPYFEQHNPEGLCIATYMNVSTNVGVSTVVLYFFIIRCVYSIPHSIAVPLILVSSTFAAFLAAMVFDVAIEGVSVFLFICCAIGGSTGAMASVVMNPFLTKYQNDFISASRSGGSFCIVLSAVLAAIQGPGSAHPRFGTKIYMTIMGIILSFPIFAYVYIVRNDIGLREEVVGGVGDGYDRGERGEKKLNMRNNNHTHSNSHNNHNSNNGIIDNEGNINGDLTGRYSYISRSEEHAPFENYEEDSLDHSSTWNILDSNVLQSDHYIENSNSDTVLIHLNHGNQKYEDNMRDNNNNNHNNDSSNSNDNNDNDGNSTKIKASHKDIIDYIIPSSLLQYYPWLRSVLPMCAIIGFVNMNTWGIVTAVAPFAFQNVSPRGQGASMLGYAYELGAVCLMLGDLSTTICHIPNKYTVTLFACFTFTVYIAALHLFTVDSSVAAPILVFCFGFGRFFEAHLVTAVYRKIASDFHPSDRENAARACGVSDQLSTTMGSILSSLLVARYAQC